MKNQIIKTFTSNSTWVCPYGVTSVTILSTQNINPISISYATTSFIDYNQKLYTCGANFSGILGVGDINDRSSPTAVLGNMNWKEMLIGDNYNTSYGITTSGELYAWGSNSNGNLGVGDVTPRSSPTLVLGGLTFKSINHIFMSNNSGSSCGITANGRLYVWGNNSNGCLGDGTIITKSSPVAVLSNLTFSKAQVSSSSSFGLTDTGQLYAWGNNSYGQLGVGDVIPRSSPVLVLGGLTFIDAKIGNYFNNYYSYGITTSGKIYTWGYNASGQLGNGTIINKSTPTLIAGELTFNTFKVYNDGSSNNLSYGITTSGDLYVWGYNGRGNLGVGDTVLKSTPTLVLGGLKWSSATVTNSSHGITTSGDLYAWGDNYYGNLGVGDTLIKTSPTAVLSSGLKWKDIKFATRSSFGITTSGDLYAWGLNPYGILGVGDIASRSSPTLVLGGIKWDKIFTMEDGDYMLGITNERKMYTWGSNVYSQLGTGDTLSKSSPTLVYGNPLCNANPITQSQTVSVVPGESYNIILSSYFPSFGNETIGKGIADSITLIYYK